MGKYMHQSRDRADQTEQWRNADNDFENDEAPFQAHHLMTGTRLNGLHVFGTRSAQMLQRHATDPRQRRRVVMYDAPKPLRTFARRETFDFMLDYWRHDFFA